MSHYSRDRDEPAYRAIPFGQPYSKGLKRLQEEVLTHPEFDPSVLWQWGTMQASAVIEILRTCERVFGRAGQEAVCQAIHRVGLDIGRQILAEVTPPPDMSEAEFMSYFATMINRVAYASAEAPKVDSDDMASFDILWCPHQDHYQAFDCRDQRYMVQGMLDALKEKGFSDGWQVRFDSTIPAGASTCHFTMWKDRTGQAAASWQAYTDFLDEKALRLAERETDSHHS